MLIKKLIQVAVAVAGLSAAGVAQAAICQFIPTSGNWDVAGNWANCTGGDGVPANTPGPSDRAEITGKTVILPAGVFNVGDIYIGAASIEGAGIGSSTLNVVNAGGIAWASGSYTFRNILVNFTTSVSGTIPAASGPLTIDTAVLTLQPLTGAMLADTITITGAGAKFKNGGTFFPATSLTMVAGGQFENDPSATFFPTTNFTLNGTAGSFINKGNFALPPGLTVSLPNAPAFSQPVPTGVISSSGSVGTLEATGQTLQLDSGSVAGNPAFNVGTLLNNGAILAPTVGQSIAINGDFVNANNVNARLAIEITFNSTVIVSSKVLVSGTATLNGGGVDFYYVDTGFGAYTTTEFDTIPFLQAGSVAPGFSEFSAPLTGNSTTLAYTSTEAQFVVGPPVSPDVGLSPTSMTFPNTVVSTISAPLVLTITNTGTAPLNFFNIFTSTANFDTSYVPPKAPPVETEPQRLGNVAGESRNVGTIARSAGGKAPAMDIKLTKYNGDSLPNVTRPANPSCGSFLNPGNLCDVDITFTPTVTGPLSDQITINSDAPTAPHFVPLDGVSVLTAAADIGVTGPTTFPVTAAGSTSGVQTITITNTGTANLVLSSLTNSDVFTFSDTVNGPPPQSAHWCGFGSDPMGFPLAGTVTIPPAATCQLVLNFKPLSATVYNATITIVSNAPSSPTLINLTGTGAVGATATLTPDPMNFGNVMVSSTSSPLTATFTNTSASPLTLSGIGVGPDFNVTGGTCVVGNVIASSGGTCTVTVTTTPSTLGLIGSALQITTTPLSNNPLVVLQVTGVAAVPAPAIVSVLTAAGSLGIPFSYTVIATNSPTLFGATGLPSGLTINSATGLISGTPTASGTFPVTISATNGSGTGSATLTVTIAVGATPSVLLSQTTVPFGNQTVNTTSAATTVTLTNNGTAGLVIFGITSSGDFGFTSTCPISTPPLVATANCNINITFTPLTLAVLSGTITITSNAPGSPHTITLSGTGVSTAVPVLTLDAASLTFPPTVVGTTSALQTLQVTNTGLSNLTLTSIVVSGPFTRQTGPTVPRDCGATLAPAASCLIWLEFSPRFVGLGSGQVAITHDAAGSPTKVPLTGTGDALPAPRIFVVSGLSFGDQVLNVAATQPLNIDNAGTAVLNIASITLSGADAASFRVAGTCTSVAAGGTCGLNITFNPTSIGSKTAVITVVSNTGSSVATTAPTVVNTIALTGNGIRSPQPAVALSLSTVGFGNSIFGGASTPQPVTLTNTGSATLVISNIAVSADFLQMNNCGGALSSAASCVINVMFSPLGMGARLGELQVFSNAVGSPHRVNLSGTGCRWFSQAQSRFFLTTC